MAPPKKATKAATRSNAPVAVGVALVALSIGLFIFYQSPAVETIAPQSTFIGHARWNQSCHRAPNNCVRDCARVVVDGVLNDTDVNALLRVVQRGMALSGGGSGGASIMDLHSGALSLGENFVDLYREAASRNAPEILSEEDFASYGRVKDRIHATVEREFSARMFLTSPTFFSRLTAAPAVTAHDEYWHTHVDKITYGSFDVTCLLYLNDFGVNFTGGDFLFVDAEESESDTDAGTAVQPRAGRLSCFTSGPENPHRVRQVTSGVRYALTIAFTCDESKAIPVPRGMRAGA